MLFTLFSYRCGTSSAFVVAVRILLSFDDVSSSYEYKVRKVATWMSNPYGSRAWNIVLEVIWQVEITSDLILSSKKIAPASHDSFMLFLLFPV